MIRIHILSFKKKIGVHPNKHNKYRYKDKDQKVWFKFSNVWIVCKLRFVI